jgi:fluoroquinolone transport system permease protein
MKRFAALISGELKGIVRDPALLMLLFAPVMIFFLISYGFPFLAGLMAQKTGFDVSGYSCAAVSFMGFLPAMMAGMLSGLTVIDERDEGLIYYYSVTPLSKKGYLLYKVIFYGALSFVSTFVLLAFNLFCPFPAVSSLAASVLFCVEAYIFTLFFAVFASNKIEVMAMGKFLGIMTAGPLIAWLAPYPWKL